MIGSRRNSINLSKDIKTTILRFISLSFFIRAISLLLTAYYTRVLSVSEYGSFALLVLYTNLASTFFSLNIFDSITYVNKKFSRSILSLSKYHFLFAVICSIPILFFLDKSQFEFRPLIIFIGTNLSFVGLVLKNISIATRNVLWSTIKQIFETLGAFILFLSFESSLSEILELRIYSLYSAQFLGGLVAFLFMIRAVANLNRIIKIDISELYRILVISLRFSVPKLPYILGGILLAQIDRVMIKSLLGLDEVGIYSAWYTMAGIAGIISGALWSASSASIYDELALHGGKNSATLIELRLIYDKVSPFVFLGIALFGFIVLPQAYRSYFYLFPLLFWSYSMLFEASSYNRLIEWSGENWLLLPGVFVGLLSNLVINWVFLEQYGLIAAAISSFFGTYLQVLITRSLVVRRFEPSFSLRKVLNGVFYMVVSILGYAL